MDALKARRKKTSHFKSSMTLKEMNEQKRIEEETRQMIMRKLVSEARKAQQRAIAKMEAQDDGIDESGKLKDAVSEVFQGNVSFEGDSNECK